MDNVEKVIKEKLFPALFESSLKDVPYASDDLNFYYQKAYDTLNGVCSGIINKIVIYCMPVEDKMVFCRNVFKLDKFVEEICPENYYFAREVVKNFILQDDASGYGLLPRVENLRSLISAMALEKPLIDSESQLENSIFFSGVFYKNQNSSIKVDKNILLDSGNTSDIGTWFFYNFLKTGNPEKAMRGLRNQIIRGCSKEPSKINEYIDVVKNQSIGVLLDKDIEKFYDRLPDSMKSSEIEKTLYSVLSIRSIAGKYQEMLCDLMHDNNMLLPLNNVQKEESSRCIVDMFSQGSHLLDTFTEVVEKSNSFNFDLESHLNAENFDLAVKTFKFNDEQAFKVIESLRTMNGDDIKAMTKHWHLLIERNSHIPLGWYEIAYKERHANDSSDFYNFAKESFLNQINLDLSKSFAFSQDVRDGVEMRLTHKLENFIDWIDDSLQFSIFSKSLTSNPIIEPPIRQFFKKHCHKDYCDLLYSIKESQSKQDFSGFSYDISCEWKGEKYFLNFNNVGTLGIKNIEIENLKIQNVIYDTVAKNSSDKPKNLDSSGFKL